MKTVIEWISDHVRLILIGQLVTLIALLVLTAIATESFALYLAVGFCGSLLFASSVAIVLVVWWLGNAKVNDGGRDQ